MKDNIRSIFDNYVKHKHKIRFAILSVFLGLSIIATLITSSYTYFQMENVMKITSRDLIDKTQRVIINDTMDYLNPARFIPMISAGLMHRDTEDILQSHELEEFLMESLAEFPQIDAFYNGDENGDALIVGRVGFKRVYVFSENKPLPEAAIYFVRKINREKTPNREQRYYYTIDCELIAQEQNTLDSNTFDPRLRPWYASAKRTKQRIWTNIYLYETRDLGLTFAVPIFNNEYDLSKVMSADITVTKISDLLSHQKASRSGINFIVTADGSLAGYPDATRLVQTINHQPQIARLDQINEPSLLKAFNLYQKTHEPHIFFTNDNIDYIAHFTPFPSSLGKNWILGMVAPADDFIGPIKETSREVLMISVIILGLASLFLVIFSHKISYPIERLAGQMLKIRNLDIEDEPPIDSSLQELSQMDQALRAMKEGLNSFSKFVPKSLVQRLIESGQEAKLGGERKHLTFLFSDIENFTAISEKMSSDQLIKLLSEYLNELSTIILHQHGTIDKYIGDSIMAFWGAPDRDEQQVFHACHAVWLCAKKLDDLNHQWSLQGKPPLKTRFGLHQGDAVVGNVGSADRLNYTVIGDNVNLGSRLEGLNKMYGTYIMASEVVYEKAKDKFLFRLIDIVAVKGREEGIKVYQMIGKFEDNPKPSVSPQDVSMVAKTQLAFEAYLAQDWARAKTFYDDLIKDNPDDKIAQLYLQRISDFKMTPPPENWDGINHLKIK